MPKTESSQAILPFDVSTDSEIETLARRTRAASGPLMKIVTYFGSKAENVLEALPDGIKDVIEDITAKALSTSFDAATSAGNTGAIPDIGTWGHKIAVMATGAGGGLSGLASTLVELPATVTIMFASIQRIAREHGFDTAEHAIKLECLSVFGAGGPVSEDDGVDISFLASKLVVTGASVQAVISAVAPRFALILGQKLAAQSVPVLGAVTGATVNFAFLNYYEEMAHVRFALLRLAERHGPDAVGLSFKSAMQNQKRPARR